MTPRTRAWILTALLACWANPALAESDFEAEIRLLSESLELEAGSAVADIGAGDGEYAIALAGIVGSDGRVYATELGAEDRAAIAEAAQEAGASVSVVEARVDGTGLPAESCDGVFLRTVYHHLTEPEAFTKDLLATVRPGGRLVIVDFLPSFWLSFSIPDGIPDDRGGHGVPPEVVIRELESAGFRHLKTVEQWPGHGFITKTYGLVFERP